MAPWIRPDNVDNDDRQSLMLFGEEEETNKWHVSMQKCLRQLGDQYLQRVDDARDSSGPQQATELWNGWNEFCRPHDCNQLVLNVLLSDRGSNNDDDDNNFKASAAAARGNALGQYFCHGEMVQQLVHVWKKQQLTESNNKGNILFVEPVCGHGQVV